MNVKLSQKDYIWSFLGVILSLLTAVIITPFAMYFLNDDYFGLWGVFQSLASITTLFDFGFSTTFARNINYCWNGALELQKSGVNFSHNAEPNYYLMKKALAACKAVFVIISSAALFIALTIGTIYIKHISKEIPDLTPIIAWLLYAFAIFLNLLFGYYSSFLRGVGAIYEVNKTTVISRLIQIILTVILLFSGFGIVGISVAYLAYGTVFRALGRHYFYGYHGIGKALDSVNIKIPKVEIKETFLVVWHNAWREGLVSLANYLANQACTIICSLFMSLASTGVYSLGVQLATAISNISGALYTANQPVLQSAYINNDTDRMRKTMSLIVVSYSALFFAGLLAVCTLGLPILRIIKPSSVVSVPVMVGIGMYQFILKFRNCYTSYFSCTNRIIYVRAFLISSFACVVLSVVALAVFNFGIWGLIFAQIISQLAYNAWAWTLKAHKEMKLSFKETLCYGYEELIKIFARKKEA